jgi:ribosomal-protein-alanine N-acetyltransferase
MSAAVRPRTEIRLMQPADLKSVAAVERAAYQYPWSLGIFRDCLLAGYYCLVLDVGGTVTAYGIMSVAAGEAHLLNLCVHPNAQRLGYGRWLLSALMLRATDAGADKIFLECGRRTRSRCASMPPSVSSRSAFDRPTIKPRTA